jgi:hypothetical protein
MFNHFMSLFLETVGLQVLHMFNSTIQFYIKSVMALCFLPIDMVECGFVLLFDRKKQIIDEIR